MYALKKWLGGGGGGGRGRGGGGGGFIGDSGVAGAVPAGNLLLCDFCRASTGTIVMALGPDTTSTTEAASAVGI